MLFWSKTVQSAVHILVILILQEFLFSFLQFHKMHKHLSTLQPCVAAVFDAPHTAGQQVSW